MPDNVSPPAKGNPVIMTSLIAAALVAVALTAAGLSSSTGGAMQDMLRGAGFGPDSALVAEQRRQAQALERIERAVGGVRADITLLHARIDEAGKRDQDAANMAPVNRASGNLAPDNPSQGNPPGIGPEFDLGALRTSFAAEAATPGARPSRPHPRRAGKVGREV
jgi:hypothetical protein